MLAGGTGEEEKEESKVCLLTGGLIEGKFADFRAEVPPSTDSTIHTQ